MTYSEHTAHVSALSAVIGDRLLFRRRWNFDTSDMIYWIIIIYTVSRLPSVLWHCWFGVTKSISGLQKIEWWDVGVVTCIWSSWCHCHPCFIEIQICLTFVLHKRSSNGCHTLCLPAALRAAQRAGI